jgi:hypothetical protein
LDKKLKRPPLQIKQSKMNWRCGSNSRAPVLQVQSPSPKPRLTPPPQKKERKKKDGSFDSPKLAAGIPLEKYLFRNLLL